MDPEKRLHGRVTVPILNPMVQLEEALAEAVKCLRSGGIVCFPTDTTYGLAVDPFNAHAVDALFGLKGRGADKPILVLVDSLAMLETVAVTPAGFEAFARRFWPGPITAVLPARDEVSPRLTAGTGTIGVRWPEAEIPRALLAAFGRPVTATSANRSGMPVVATIDEAVAAFRDVEGSELGAVIDGGVRPVTGASTLIDMTQDPAVLVRGGPVGIGELEAFFGGRVRVGTP